MTYNKYTSLDVAEKAGVSQATVSRALRGSPVVNSKTAEKIKEIAAKLNYKVDKNASNLRAQSNNTIALLILKAESQSDSFISPFFSAIISSITNSCFEENIDLLVSFQKMDNDWHSDFEESNKADGLILLGYYEEERYALKLNKLLEKQTHFVTWGFSSTTSKLTSINTDNFNGGKLAAKHLLKRNHRKIAFLGDISRKSPESEHRYKGFCSALKEINSNLIPVAQIDAIATEGSGYDAAIKLLNSKVSFTAIFTTSDVMALGVILALSENSLSVPEDISIVGYDDIPSAEYYSPPLTTIRQPATTAGKLLVSELIKQIQGKNSRSRKIPVELIERKSCKYLA